MTSHSSDDVAGLVGDGHVLEHLHQCSVHLVDDPCVLHLRCLHLLCHRPGIWNAFVQTEYRIWGKKLWRVKINTFLNNSTFSCLNRFSFLCNSKFSWWRRLPCTDLWLKFSSWMRKIVKLAVWLSQILTFLFSSRISSVKTWSCKSMKPVCHARSLEASWIDSMNQHVRSEPFLCGYHGDLFPIGSPNSAILWCPSLRVLLPSFACQSHA